MVFHQAQSFSSYNVPVFQSYFEAFEFYRNGENFNRTCACTFQIRISNISYALGCRPLLILMHAAAGRSIAFHLCVD